MTETRVEDTLFCTDTFIERYGDDVRAVAPDLDIVALTGDEPVSPADIERITFAFFSSDAWPERTPAFMRVALDASNLTWLHTMSAGVDNPIFGMFTGRGVRVTTSSGASAEPIAATAMMYLLALSRGLPDLFRAQASHEWRPKRFRELAGQSIAVVGYGPIGEHVARLAAALGMHPTIVRRRAVGDEAHPVRPLADIASIVADVDAVVVALPLVEATHGLISAEVIANMRAGALFVNVGRGELVDQHALSAALRDGHLGGAGLDVFTPEPLPSDDPLWDLPNVIVTPHNSGTSDGTEHRAALIFLDNLERLTSGRELLNQVG